MRLELLELRLRLGEVAGIAGIVQFVDETVGCGEVIGELLALLGRQTPSLVEDLLEQPLELVRLVMNLTETPVLHGLAELGFAPA